MYPGKKGLETVKVIKGRGSTKRGRTRGKGGTEGASVDGVKEKRK